RTGQHVGQCLALQKCRDALCLAPHRAPHRVRAAQDQYDVRRDQSETVRALSSFQSFYYDP
ncbi:hypothetical protein HAX54_009813, partial [Datura stramonium]|nr:hypothetical protein [Datura stramonium]